MPNSMVTEISRVVGSTTLQVTGQVGNYDPDGQVFVQVFVTQEGGAIATGGGSLRVEDKGTFTVDAEPVAGSQFLQDVALLAVSHATEIWASPLTGPPTQAAAVPHLAIWRSTWDDR